MQNLLTIHTDNSCLAYPGLPLRMLVPVNKNPWLTVCDVGVEGIKSVTGLIVLIVHTTW